jgi:hypothetical protein
MYFFRNAGRRFTGVVPETRASAIAASEMKNGGPKTAV